jgi:hypothetical protein
VRAVLGLAVLLAVVAGACSGDDEVPFEPAGPLHRTYPDAPEGSAFEEAVEQGTYGALMPGHFLDTALVALRNVTNDHVQVIGAEPVWVAPGVEADRFALSPPGARVPGTRRDEHSAGSLAFEDAAPVGPIRQGEPEPLITFEVALAASTNEGVVVGIDVFYEQDGEVRWQRWPLIVLVCDWDSHPDGCDGYEGRSIDDLDFAPLLSELTAKK